jgi:hypothetical protein
MTDPQSGLEDAEGPTAGVGTIRDADVATTAFVGPTQAGAFDRVSLPITSLVEFERDYGGATLSTRSDDWAGSDLMWHAARGFFANGGQRLYVVRLRPGTDAASIATAYATAFAYLESVSDVSIVAAPGASDDGVAALIAHAEKMRYRFAIIDAEPGQTIEGVRHMRASLDSRNAALYYPWIRVADPLSGSDLMVPPSGCVAGVYARVALERGVQTAQANQPLHLVTSLERDVPSADQNAMDAAGINVLRTLPSRGTVIWSARTISADPDWKYVNIRRLLIFLEASIDRGLQWVVFEPNSEPTWSRVRQAVQGFLTDQWRHGALLGTKAEQAFFVHCDRTTMTQDDIDSGRLVCLVGVAPVKPAEFVIFRIGQWTADAKH